MKFKKYLDTTSQGPMYAAQLARAKAEALKPQQQALNLRTILSSEVKIRNLWTFWHTPI
jgi:hypothetical protein